MGQKVSPIGMRVGVIRDWESRWYADKAKYGDLLNEDIKIRTLIEKELKDAYVSRIEIERTSEQDCKVVIRCARPGAAVGKYTKKSESKAEARKDGKERIELLKESLTKLTGGKNIKVEIVQIANPDLDATIVARHICEQLEQRQSFRIAQKKAIQQTMRSGAKGIKTLASGRLGGAEIARSEGYSQGVVPLHTLRSDIDYAADEAHTTYGKLGVKVWICRGEVLPGQMVKEPEAPQNGGRNDRRGRTGRNDRRTRRPAKPTEEQASAPVEQVASAPEVVEAAPTPEVVEGGNE